MDLLLLRQVKVALVCNSSLTEWVLVVATGDTILAAPQSVQKVLKTTTVPCMAWCEAGDEVTALWDNDGQYYQAQVI